jgi:AraC-like DNA-binding protein
VHSGERLLFANRLFEIGEFHCAPGNWRWRCVNAVGEGDYSYLAFPRTSVLIQQIGHEPILANPNHVLFYRRGQRFLRTLHDPRGDHCTFVRIAPEPLAELLREARVKSASDDLPFVQGPSDPRAYLALRCATHTLRSGSVETLALEEAVLEALRRSLERAAELQAHRRRPARGSTDRQHHLLVEEAKSLLTERVTKDDTIGSLAQALHVSPFHLARVFRERTGFTLHRYRTHLRLLLAIDRLADPDVDLATIAAEAGFTSHSHFTDAFRALFLDPPSRVRGTLGRPDLLRLREATDASRTPRGSRSDV